MSTPSSSFYAQSYTKSVLNKDFRSERGATSAADQSKRMNTIMLDNLEFRLNQEKKVENEAQWIKRNHATVSILYKHNGAIIRKSFSRASKGNASNGEDHSEQTAWQDAKRFYEALPGAKEIINIDIGEDRPPCSATNPDQVHYTNKCSDFFKPGGGATQGAPGSLIFVHGRDLLVYSGTGDAQLKADIASARDAVSKVSRRELSSDEEEEDEESYEDSFPALRSTIPPLIPALRQKPTSVPQTGEEKEKKEGQEQVLSTLMSHEDAEKIRQELLDKGIENSTLSIREDPPSKKYFLWVRAGAKSVARAKEFLGQKSLLKTEKAEDKVSQQSEAPTHATAFSSTTSNIQTSTTTSIPSTTAPSLTETVDDKSKKPTVEPPSRIIRGRGESRTTRRRHKKKQRGRQVQPQAQQLPSPMPAIPISTSVASSDINSLLKEAIINLNFDKVEDILKKSNILSDTSISGKYSVNPCTCIY